MTPQPKPQPQLIFKVASRDVADAARASGTFTGMPVDDADGYLHFSTAPQLPETLRRYFAGQREVALLAVRAADVEADLRWEPSRGGALFPHVYGTLPMSAVVHEATIAVADDGTCHLPEWVR